MAVVDGVDPHDRPSSRVSTAGFARVWSNTQLHHVVMIGPVRATLIVIQAVRFHAPSMAVDVIECRLGARLRSKCVYISPVEQQPHRVMKVVSNNFVLSSVAVSPHF